MFQARPVMAGLAQAPAATCTEAVAAGLASPDKIPALGQEPVTAPSELFLTILLRLLAQTPPYKTLTYLAFLSGLSPAAFLERAPLTLQEMLLELQAAIMPDPLLVKNPLQYLAWFETLQDQMEEPFEKWAQSRPLQLRYTRLAHRRAGRITVEEALDEAADPEEELRRWAREVEIVILSASTLAGGSGALDQLIQHEKWVQGHVRARLEEDSQIDAVFKDAWRRIHNKLHTWDPSKGSFHNFACIWISCAIRQNLR
jgi:hypothetical protein